MKLGERGQVTIPKEICEKFGLSADTEIEFEVPNGAILLRKSARKLNLDQVEGPVQGQFCKAGIHIRGSVCGWRARSMITAVDTNIFLDVLLPNEDFCDASAAALETAASAGSLVICDLVYAELCIHLLAQWECDEFLAENEVRVESRAASFAASQAWRTYRKQGDNERGFCRIF